MRDTDDTDEKRDEEDLRQSNFLEILFILPSIRVIRVRFQAPNWG